MVGPINQTRWLGISILAVVLSFTVVGQSAADDAVQLAARLSALRGEVEALSAQLGEKQAAYRSQLQGYARQEADLSLEARRGETAVAKLRLSIDTIRKKNMAIETAAQVLDPVLANGIAQMERYVAEALPFKKKARLQALSDIRRKRQENSLTPDQALNRLWAFLEDELRMQRESVVYRQEIAINGQSVLADVLRVGMVMMFYRVKGQGVGYAKRTNDSWTYVESTTPEDVKQIKLAFEQFGKQVRVGSFVLPNQLTVTEDK